ncbi:AraC family transcriptional regulator [Bradyrhizobium sp. URHC0002]
MEGQQRVGVLVEVPQVLRELGKDPARVVARAGVNPDLLRDPDNSLSFGEFGRLVEVCVAETGCNYFGLLVGQRAAIAHLGLVGRLMQNAPTLKDAILDLCKNQKRYVSGAVAYLLIQNETAFWGYTIHHPAMRAVEQVSEGAMATAFALTSELVGIPPDAILMACRTHDDVAPYRQFFGYAPTFNAQQYAAVFPAALLAHPVRGADRELRRILEKSVANYWALKQPSITQSVVRILHALVVSPDATLERVADELSMHPRTLNRRLEADGTSFRTLVNEARFSVSRQLLSGTKMDVADISLALGYADPSGFTHAFQRWSGMAPIEWRKQDVFST